MPTNRGVPKTAASQSRRCRGRRVGLRVRLRRRMPVLDDKRGEGTDGTVMSEMSGGHPARATLDAWRASGADRVDPLRLQFIDALPGRGASPGGAARRVLDGRLSALLDEYAAFLEETAKPKAAVDSA